MVAKYTCQIHKILGICEDIFRKFIFVSLNTAFSELASHSVQKTIAKLSEIVLIKNICQIL